MSAIVLYNDFQNSGASNYHVVKWLNIMVFQSSGGTVLKTCLDQLILSVIFRVYILSDNFKFGSCQFCIPTFNCPYSGSKDDACERTWPDQVRRSLIRMYFLTLPDESGHISLLHSGSSLTVPPSISLNQWSLPKTVTSVWVSLKQNGIR